MKIYEIWDQESRLSVGTLLCYEKSKTFVIELADYLDEWSAPLILTAYVRRGIFTIPRDISLMWVRERIIPSGRQNIDMILRNHGLREYDELTFLEKSGGRCSQDSLCIRKLEALPEYVERRRGRTLKDCTLCAGKTLLCFFLDGTTKKVDLNTYTGSDENEKNTIRKILENEDLFASGKITAGGYAVTFNDSLDLSASALYASGVTVPLGLEDFLSFVRNNMLDTSGASDVLLCSRQNLAYLVGKGELIPVREEVKGNLYLKGDVLAVYND